MGKRRRPKKRIVVVNYPPVTTKKWIPPDQRKKKKRKQKYPNYPPQLHQRVEGKTCLKKVWHAYRILHGCAILIGHYSQLHHRYLYTTNGYQGTSNCVIAVLFSKFTDCSQWNAFMLDYILNVGDKYYQLSRKPHGTKKILKVTELAKDLYLYNHRITLCLKGKKKYTGMIFRDLDHNPDDYLETVLGEFFCKNEAGVLSTVGNVGRHFGIWQCGTGYFLFDPSDHDDMCWPWKGLPGKGSAFLVRFPNLEKLAQVIQRNLNAANVEFEVTPIAIERIVTVNVDYPDCLRDAALEGQGPKLLCVKEEKLAKILDEPVVPIETMEDDDEDDEEGPDEERPKAEENKMEEESPTEPLEAAAKPKKQKRKMVLKPRVDSVTFFSALVPERIGILLADLHQNDTDFAQCRSNKCLCNALAALVMLRECKSRYWTTKRLTNVLRLGFRICKESSRLAAPEQTFKLENIVRKIVLGEESFSPVITKYGAVGRLQSIEEEVLDLLPALKEVFSECDTVVLQGPLVVAIWKELDRYYMFDPYERDPNGVAIVKEIKVGSVLESVDYISGVACLLWFTDLADLIEMYMLNVERARRRDQFIISNVEIRNFVELPENWMNFSAVDPDRWILRGNFAQSDRKFERASRNTQCSANCAMAIAFTRLVPIGEWTTDTLDQILNEGDAYYAYCVMNLQKKEKFVSSMLLLSELSTEFVVDNKLICLDIAECLINGLITLPDEFKATLNLKKGLEEFFKDNDCCILTCRGICVALWKRGDAYYYFDSHDRNHKGFRLAHGKACVQRITTTDKMAECIMANLAPESILAVYNLSRVDVQVFNPPPADAPLDEDDYEDIIDSPDDDQEDDMLAKFDIERPLYNYTKLTKKRAILRSRFDQSDPIFGTNAGKQLYPNLIAAVGMARVFPPEAWDQDLLDDVLWKGNEIYDSSMQTYYAAQAARNLQEEEDPDEDDAINLENVSKGFKIGVNKFNVEFEQVSEGTIGETGLDLAIAIKDFFKDEENREALIHTDQLDIVVWKNGILYYLFDPNARDEKGCVYGKEEWSIVQHPLLIVEEDNTGYEELEMEEDENEELPEDEQEGEETAATEEQIENFLIKEWQVLGNEEEEETYAPQKHPKEYWEELERSEGKACTIWFTKPKYLVKHVIANNPPKLREESKFTLTRMVLVNEPDIKDVFEGGVPEDPIVGDWHDYKEITKGQWILRGSMHLKNVMFPEFNRGMQASANAMIALSFAHLYVLSKFTKRTVDEILKYGDRLYTYTKRMRRKELSELDEVNLTPEEIDEVVKRERYDAQQMVKNFCIADDKVTEYVELDFLTGEVHAHNMQDELDVEKALEQFFAANIYGILTSKDVTVAIWKHGIFYYMYDSFPRGPHGCRFQNGFACITRFTEVAPMAELFLKNLPIIGKNFFTVHKVEIQLDVCQKPVKAQIRREVEDGAKITGYVPVMPGKSLIRGTICQDDIKFGRGTNAQCSTIAVVALAMTLVHKCEYWTRAIIDEIVTIGDSIYGELLDRCDFIFNPWEEKLTVRMAPNDFRIGKIKVNSELRNTIQAGVIDIKNPKILNIRQGIERFFEENSTGVIETDFLTVAIWESEDENNSNFLYMFDPNARSATGQPLQEGGTATVLKFCGAKIMAEHIVSLVHSERDGQFLITPVEIVIEYNGRKRKTKKYGLMKKKDSKIESARTQKLGRYAFYAVPGGEFELLRGTRSQNSSQYSANSRGNQDVPNCIIAYIMDKLIPLCKWNYKNVDMVLDAGDQLYKDSYIIYNPRDAKLRLETLIRDIILKDVRVKISVGAPVLTAKFERKLLTEALQTCFNLKNFCILLFDNNATCVFKKEEHYYLFYPNDLDLHGIPVEEGSAAVLRFKCLMSMINMIVKMCDCMLQPSVFHVIVVAVKEIERVPTGTTFMETHPKILSREPKICTCDKTLYGHVRKL